MERWNREALVKIQAKTTMMVCAPINSGKTFFVQQLLEHADGIFTIPPLRILYCYGIYQNKFDEMMKTVKNIQFHQGLPTEENIEDLTKGSEHSICVLDDLMDLACESSFIQKLFFSGNHLNLSTINIVQNIFQRGKVGRTCSLNTQYFILFRQQRDMQQILCLGKQIFLGRSSFFMDAFYKATNEPFGYLLIDINPYSDRRYQLRTKILPGEDTRIYLPLK